MIWWGSCGSLNVDDILLPPPPPTAYLPSCYLRHTKKMRTFVSVLFWKGRDSLLPSNSWKIQNTRRESVSYHRERNGRGEGSRMSAIKMKTQVFSSRYSSWALVFCVVYTAQSSGYKSTLTHLGIEMKNYTVREVNACLFFPLDIIQVTVVTPAHAQTQLERTHQHSWWHFTGQYKSVPCSTIVIKHVEILSPDNILLSLFYHLAVRR